GVRQLTRDHSLVQSMVDDGRLSPDEARSSPYRSQILQAVGLPRPPMPEFHDEVLTTGSRVLLCSDGLWEAVAPQELAADLEESPSASRCAASLMDRALSAGAKDNVSVTVYDHRSAAAIDSDRPSRGDL